MASFDMNKPPTGTWTPANATHSNAGKTVGAKPGRGKMASESETKSAPSGNRTTAVASNMDLPMWPNSVALELSLFLSMYNANNLSLMANASSISPFGLFPLALPVPGVPIVPKHQDSTTRVPPALERLVDGHAAQKGMPNVSNCPTSAMQMHLNGTISVLDVSKPRDHWNTKATEKSTIRSTKSTSMRKNHGHQSLHGDLPFNVNGIIGNSTSRERPEASPLTENIKTGMLGRLGARPVQNSQAKHGIPICSKVGIVSHKPPVLETIHGCAKPSSGHCQAKIPKKVGNTGNAATQPGRNRPRTHGRHAASTMPLPLDSQFRDAEAAAILLGLRHGLDEQGEPSAVAGNNSSNVGSARLIKEPGSSHNPYAKMIAHKTADFSQTPPPAQAVDLSTKTKLKPQCVPRLCSIISKHNITKQAELRNAESQSCLRTSELKVPTSQMDKPVLNKILSGSQKIMSSSPQKDASIERVSSQFRSQGIGNNRESTSVVSHLPSCICAFDNPSSVEGCSAHGEHDRVFEGSQIQPLTGFNFKKAICEKFSQATTCNAFHSKDGNSELSCGEHSYVIAESTSRTYLQPTWSRKNPCMQTHTSAIQKSAKRGEHSRGSDRRSFNAPAQTQSSATVRLHGRETNSVSSTSRLLNDRLKSNVQSPIRIQEKTIHEGSEKTEKSTNYAARTSSTRTALSTASSGTKVGSIPNQRSDLKHTVPSFSALRQKSVEFRNSFSRTDSSARTVPGKTLAPTSSSSKANQAYKPLVPSSNLYRIRKSGLGGSNDSLHSDHSEKKVQKQESGDDSDSSGSASESDSSGAGNSDESDDEISMRTVESYTVKNAQETSSPSRSRFVLSQPKFTLGPGEANMQKNKDPLASSNGSGPTFEIPTSSPSSKVKIRKPTFTFSSNGCSETKPTSEAEILAKIPELKCDADDGQNSFKYKLIQALSKPDSKEGVAVDGKSLRALVGEADYFYHNNKKYVLKRYFKKTKPTGTNVSGTNEGCQPNRSVRRDVTNDNTTSERRNQPRIEPRISVTARKRTEIPELPFFESKKAKKLKKRDIDTRARNKGIFERVRGEKRAKLEAEVATKHGIPRNKRRRRIHEIDNLVFEGAGGLTPIPDLSLRDSDVFSNIKLRRREAAKKVITEPTSERDSISRKTSLRTKWLKTAAQERAIANENRKKSIEKKLRKYRKKKRHFVLKQENSEQKSPALRSSCVRINAGISRPHVDTFAGTSALDEKKTVEGLKRKPSCHDSDSTVASKLESKQVVGAGAEHSSLEASDDVDEVNSTTARGNATVSHESKQCCKSAEKDLDSIRGSLEQRFEASNNVYEHRRRVSKRISARKDIERRPDDKKPDDDVTVCDSDSVRSESPLPSSSRGRIQRKRKSVLRERTNPSLTRLTSTKASRNTQPNSRSSGFTLFSCFPTPPAMTLAAAHGDLQPSYTMKGLRKVFNGRAWKVGSSALDTKQQLQREMWRNMTLDMFTNGKKVIVHNS